MKEVAESANAQSEKSSQAEELRHWFALLEIAHETGCPTTFQQETFIKSKERANEALFRLLEQKNKKHR